MRRRNVRVALYCVSYDTSMLLRGVAVSFGVFGRVARGQRTPPRAGRNQRDLRKDVAPIL